MQPDPSSAARHRASRRRFLRDAGVSAAAANFLYALPSLAESTPPPARQRIVFVFSPNGVIPGQFWPDIEADAGEGGLGDLKRILAPLEPYRDRLLTLRGIDNKVQGDGDRHMRGIGCLLTGIELFPGDVQGGSDTPAGWSMGISLDQFLKNRFQADPATRTRFGSLEFGVMVPDRADTWTRMAYSGANQPVAPISDPYQMFDRMYGQTKNRAMVASILDDLGEEFEKVSAMVSAEDRELLQRHVDMVRSVERDLKRELSVSSRSDDATQASGSHAVPELPPNIQAQNDNMPTITRMQIDLLVNGFLADFMRVATFQITNSVGNAKMRWLGIDEGHHSISHEPDSNEEAVDQLVSINRWYCEQVAYLAKKLAETPEPGRSGSMLDYTTIVWTNELGKGNSHTLRDIPFVLIGGGLGFRTGRALDFKDAAHNRLLLSIAESCGHPQKVFGNPDYCGDGPLTGLA